MADGGNSNDGLWMLFFVLAFIAAIAFGLWLAFKPQLLQAYIWIRQGEVAVASLWTEDDYTVPVMVGDKQGSITFGEARKMIDTLTPEILLGGEVNKWDIIKATTRATLDPLRWMFGGIVALLVYYAMFHGPTSYHRTRFNLDTLIRIQSKTFRIIKPIVDFNPAKTTHRTPGSPVPAELPLFAEALSPEEWIAFHKVPVPDGKIDFEAAGRAFAKQLGQRWMGVQKLPPYMQVLLAAFALKAAKKRIESDDILGRLAECWDAKSGLKLSRDAGLVAAARKILRNKDIAAETVKICNRHAFVTTAMIGALNYARSQGGVLAPAQFLWLRGHDRTLWYPLNNLGRQAFHAEAMGAMAHYRAEKQVQRPIPKPMIMDAVQALDAYMRDPMRVQPIPQLDFSMVKNKKDPTKNQGVLKPAGT